MGLESLISGISGGSDDESKGIVAALFDSRKSRLNMITEVTPDLIYPLTVLQVVSTKFKSKVIDSFLSELYKLQISRDRKGRGELIEALLSARTAEGLPE